MFTRIYFLLLRLAAFFNHHKAKLLCKGEKEAMAQISAKIVEGAQYIWFHAASVGEFEQGRPIIERLKEEHPEYKILLTFFSPSGYELRKNYDKADIVAYLPFATPKKASKFLDLVRPKMAIFIKYEFWPAYLRELHKRRIPTYLISAIFLKSQLFFKWYGGFYRRNLRYFDKLFVQDEASRDLLAKYGIENVVVSGDTRFDRVAQIASNAAPIQQIEQFVAGSPTLVAGSTWSADEQLLLKYCRSHNVKLVLVPHEIHEQHLHDIFNRFHGRFTRFTRASMLNIDSNDVIVVDTIGMLSSIYQYATVAYIGGGFGAGIHNTLEAAVYGVPVVFGPKCKKFREALGLIECGGGASVKNYKQLERQLDIYFENPRQYGKLAGDYVTENLGAVEIIYNTLFNN
ncbi:MAG: 3-deoxy-D-manno-octulosonic acid transferase [Paludibacteraceae bacterium]|nr:3-deoxy-D-manno-octulosonic acid transferase [Paludibacteraceae bacterium]